MDNLQRYRQVFTQSFSVEEAQLDDTFVYQSVTTWDSVGHMGMIAALEEAFGIMLEMDDIIDFSSYTKGIELLAKYDIVIDA